MGCKISIDKYNKEAGKKCYLMMTSDASSLEARVATSDTALNDSGIDPVLQKVYDPNSGYGEDLHSSTATATFLSSVHLQINEVYDEDSKQTYLVLDQQQIKIKRDGKELTILGSELKDTDSIVGYID